MPARAALRAHVVDDDPDLGRHPLAARVIDGQRPGLRVPAGQQARDGAQDRTAPPPARCEIEAAGGQAIALHANAADAEALSATIDHAAAHFGRLHILANSAGMLRMGTIDEFAASKAAAAHLRDGGRIINIGTTNTGRMPFATWGHAGSR